MTDGNEQALSDVQTLAHLLEFLSKLEESSVKTNVAKKLRKEVQQYITRSLDEFADEDGSGGYLPMTISKSTELRSNIVKSEQKYEHYTESFQNSDTDKYTELLINNIFALFGCLYYMYYECATECSGMEGGEWWQEKCNDSRHDKKHLNRWLQDKTQEVKATDKNGSLMIQRDFKQNELSNKTGTDLFPKDQEDDSNGLLSYTNGAQLQLALFFMLFLPKDDKWDHAQSGHAVLFLEAFCEKVTGGQFNGQYTEAEDGEAYKSACQHVQQNIKTLTELNIIAPVASYQEVQYKNLLVAEHFWSYAKWLKGILDKLITSLAEMASDVSKWKKNDLKESKTFGPYPWGFTFRINWESKTGQLNTPLQNLNTALSSFKNALTSIWEANSKSKGTQEPSTSPTSNNSTNSTDSTESTNSAASTLGGVVAGVGAAAATGAAAYSGVLGTAAEAIGRFFKGLFFE